jgi:uncharacterized protein (TIGR03083 family)
MDDVLLAQIQADHADLSRLLATLSDEEAARPHRLGDWSAKDLLAHLIGWEAKGIEALTAIGEERTPEKAPETDAFNAASVQDRQGASWAELRAEFDRTNRALLDVARALPEAAWQRRRTTFWLRGVTIDHYQEHRPPFASA